jgi:hypothetical protein
VSEVNPITTSGQDVKQAKQQVEIFEGLLMKCFNLEVRRRGSALELEDVRRFCNQATSDARYLVIGRLPDDIVQAIRKKKEAS